MEVNKLYKSVYNGVIVKCTSKSNYNKFGGVVVKADNSNFKVGYVGDSWLCEAFEEYQVLTNGRNYNIPDGCKATIENGVVLIESNVKCYKDSCVGCKMYFRVEGNKIVKIEIYSDDVKSVFFADGLLNVECKKECSESEFMEVYNSIKIEL